MGNDNIPIKHHYIPQFYLTNFSEDGTKNSKIWVTDQKLCKQWKLQPPLSLIRINYIR
ncbi:hypothetical protein Desaci_1240 [Desulfosporosinus acidiphilus SJ4]|uniref:DUF4238 domain-containing protein n=1 Tax=Desulfosporosinus acidiphilus (strain DSM 22704 / JCM 16185 / SJ4) TaxID=646529 RepID=I4D396_DESAJ|nr:hypothetical protein Desaci_1240 [Desulfosporosinus acidiphilus SJ4]